jgi:anti-sigma B factor antagonist
MDAPSVTESFRVEGDGGIEDPHVIEVVGELDVATSPILHDVLAAIETGSIVLDLSEVTFIDSSGLKVLVKTHTRTEGRGAELILRGARSSVRSVITATGLDEVLNLERG